MQVDRQDAVDADDVEHVGHDLGADRHTGRTRTAILTGIAEVGITAVMREAEERRKASASTTSSIRLSLVGAQVG